MAAKGEAPDRSVRIAVDGSGVAEDTAFLYESDQPVIGKIRKGTSVPYYKEAAFTGTITVSGLDSTVLMVGDN